MAGSSRLDTPASGVISAAELEARAIAGQRARAGDVTCLMKLAQALAAKAQVLQGRARVVLAWRLERL